MTVLMLIDNYFPLVGGAEKQADALGWQFVENGVKVLVVTERKEKDWKAHELVNGIPVTRLSFPKVRVIGALILYIRLVTHLLRRKGEYDVIYVHIVKYFAFIGATMGRILGKKVLIKFSGWEELDKGVLNEGMRKKVLYRILGWGVKKADYYIAISSEIEAALKRCAFPPSRIVRLPNGVDTLKFFPESDKSALRKRLGLTEASTLGVFVGRLVNEKGLPYLMTAWRQASLTRPGAVLVIVGDGYLRDELEKMAVELGIEENVVFTGQVDNVDDFMRASDFYILPSLTEGLSNTLLEAMACGLPVVGTRISGTMDLIADGKNGFLAEPGDPGSLAEKISILARDEGLRESMGVVSREIIEKEFSFGRVVERYLELFKD